MEESRAVQKYTAWINAKNVDPLIRRELLNIISSPEDITERFSENLAFGTAGPHPRIPACGPEPHSLRPDSTVRRHFHTP